MLVAALVVLIGVLLWGLIQYGGRPETVAVFKTPLTGEELVQAELLLKGQDIPVKVKDGLLMVPAERRDQAYARLAYEGIAPAKAAMELAQEPSIWQTADQARRMEHHASEALLSRLISLFPPVKTAQVIFKLGESRKLGSPGSPASAAVHVTLKRGAAMDRKLLKAMADTVAGAVGMGRSDIRIVDATNNRSYRVPEDEELDDGMLADVAAQEKRCAEKIRDLYGYIQGLLVSVDVTPDTVKTVSTTSTEYKEPVIAPVGSETEDSKNTPRGTGGEPGVAANSGVRVPVNLGMDSTVEKARKMGEPRFPTHVTQKTEGGGLRKGISVSVNVPWEYLAAQFKKATGQAAEPTRDQVEEQAALMQKMVMNAVSAENPDKVTVGWYFSGETGAAAAAVAAGQAAEAGVTIAINQFAKPAVLGGLALAALMMVMMFARRRHPTPPIIETLEPVEEEISNMAGAIDGEDGALEGLELDDETVRTQKVVEQVGEMVKENPDAASNLIRRWIESK
jgi:flagellar biosynthesis/type III secretory pathway M-ring protein FliF/YscJ